MNISKSLHKQVVNMKILETRLKEVYPGYFKDGDTMIFAQEFDESFTASILEIGANEEPIAQALFDIGYLDVTGIDLFHYKYKANFTFIQANLFQYDFKGKLFDVIICLSTVEHMGLNVYSQKEKEDKDIETMHKIASLLKPNGVVYLTIPFGIHFKVVSSPARIYTTETIQSRITPLFRVEKRLYFMMYNLGIIKAGTIISLEQVQSIKGLNSGIFLKLRKRTTWKEDTYLLG